MQAKYILNTWFLILKISSVYINRQTIIKKLNIEKRSFDNPITLIKVISCKNVVCLLIQNIVEIIYLNNLKIEIKNYF